MKKVILISILIMLVSFSTVTGETTLGSWVTKADMPTDRYYFGCTTCSGKIYAVGGAPGLQTLEEYDPVTNTWSSKAEMTYGREYVQPVSLNGLVFLVSCGNESYETPTVEAYNNATNTWEFKANVNLAVYGAGIITANGKIYKFGGYKNGQYISNAVEEYDPAANLWVYKTSMPTARWLPGVVTVNNKIYVFGGSQSFSGSPVILDSVEIYDFETDTWEVKSAMPVPKAAFGVACINGKIFILGGWTTGMALTDSIEVYDPVSEVWSAGGSMPVARAGYGTAVRNNKVYLMGGYGTGTFSLVQEYTPFPQRIAFQSTCSGDNSPANNEIYTMNPDGSEIARLTNNAFYDAAPAWSLDGTKIAFESGRDGNREIYTMNTDGNGQTNLTNNSANDEAPAWSPDGTKIAFHSDRDTSLNEIYIMNVNGTGQTRLTFNGGNQEPAWSPDGTKIVYEAGDEIYVMNADGSNPNRLTWNTTWDGEPAWSPDGTKIAFTTLRDGNKEIYVMNSDDGSNQVNLTNNSYNDGKPAWSPDGTQLVFESNRDGNNQIYLMNAAGSGQTRLNTNNADEGWPVWFGVVTPPDPTPAPTYTPSPTPSPTLEPTPTPEPTATPMPTDTPTPTPEPTATPTPEPAGSWSVKTGMSSPRYALGVEAVERLIYAIGGLYSGYVGTVEVYDIDADSWSPRADMPTRRAYFGTAMVDGKIYAVGGETDGHYPLANLEMYDPETNIWTAKTGMGGARRYLAAAAVNNKIYAVGGQDINGNIVATVEMYDPENDTWAVKTSMPTPREILGLAVVNGRIYAVGGRNNYGYSNAVEEYDPVTDTWVAKGNEPVARCQYALTAGKFAIYALAGDYGGSWPSAVAEKYDPISDTWSFLPDVPTPRFDLGTVVVDGKVYAVGGYGGTFTNLEVYTPAVNETDQTPPSLNVTPVEDAFVNSTTIAVSGSVYDASPVEVRVNGQLVTMIGSTFQTTVVGVTGDNTITIEARDSEGNTTTLVRHVTVDTVSPNSFTPVASPSDWTTNNSPVITFETTDSGSGIDHYEIRVQEGEWVTPVTSPYQCSELPDGELLVEVKAVDRAGNETVGSVPVYIDTVPPGAPTGFKACSVMGQMKLFWDDPEGEIVGYRITRVPAFSGGDSVELARTTGKLDQYLDTEVVPEITYTYTLEAKDHTDLWGTPAAPVTALIGTTKAAVGTGGGKVEFDRCALTLPAGAITEAGTVVMKVEPEATVDNEEYAAAVGPMYHFGLEDQSGQEIPAEFKEPVELKVSYAGLTLPEGCTPEDLGIFWYDEEGGYWVRLEYVGNDFVNQTLTANLLHFSDYQVMASKFASPSLDSYYDMGVSPYQSYFKNNIESVSTSSGSLSVSATDLRLPGRNGFDLVIKRTYDSTAAEQEKIIDSNNTVTQIPPSSTYYKKVPVDTFSVGWSLNIPWIEHSDKGYFLRLPEGQTIRIEYGGNRFVYHNGMHFTLQRYVTYWPCRWLRISLNVQSYKLTMADGTVYEFWGSGKVKKQIDPSGKNVVTYEYDDRELTRIVDSVGREVTFTYQTSQSSDSRRVISEIKVNGVLKAHYNYNSSGNLIEAFDAKNRKTAYDYGTEILEKELPNDPKYQITAYPLNTITYPTGGTSVYTYDPRRKTYPGVDSCGNNRTYKTHKLVVTRQETMGKVVDYAYTFNQKSGTVGTSNFVAEDSYMLSCDVSEGQKINNETFHFMIRDGIYSETYFRQYDRYYFTDYDGFLKKRMGFQGSSVYSRLTKNNGADVEKVVYDYDIPLRAIKKEEHYRGDTLTYQVTNDYDDWGNVLTRFDGSRDLVETMTYHTHDRIKNLVETKTVKNINAQAGLTTTVTTSYLYDEDLGKPTQMTVVDGSKIMVTQFNYDPVNGNLLSRTEPNGLVTEFAYDDEKQAFLKEKRLKDVADADGTLRDIVTSYTYDINSGMKKTETIHEFDGRLFNTKYDFDSLNRMTKITLPDDDSNPDNNPYREYIFHDFDTPSTCEFYNEKRQKTLFTFDGLGRLTEITKYLNGEEVKTIYSYDNQGRINCVTDPKGYNTSYDYDGMSRVVKVTYPDTNFVTLTYDDLTNMVTITDEEGGETKERSDWAGRLVEAKQYSCYNSSTEEYRWQFVYDSQGNRVRQVDPLRNATDKIYDGLSHLMQVELPDALLVATEGGSPVCNRPVLNYEYDTMGNKTAEIDARGNRKSYEYDQTGKLKKATVTYIDHLNNNEPITVVTKYYYDARGNKIRMIDPNNKEWSFNYSAQGSLLSETSPLGYTTRYQYDTIGNKTAVTDPRGNGTDGSFTTYYFYDDLNRLIKTILPDKTPSDLNDNPFTETTYDKNGNKLTERDPNGVITEYTYTSRNWVETVKVAGQLKTTYGYNKRGNQTQVTDALNHTTVNSYDSLGRLRKVLHLGENYEEFNYDALGNRTEVKDGRHNASQYMYNSLGLLTGIRDPLYNLTQYQYDLNGNKVKTIAANNLETINKYDELNRLWEQVDSLGNSSKYSYDVNGNRKQMSDRRSSLWVYQYDDNNRLRRLDVTNGGDSYYAEYTYDEAGNRKSVKDTGNEAKYNLDQNGVYQPDPLNRINQVKRNFDGAEYITGYQYNQVGQTTKIFYPEAIDWLEYKYDTQNRLSEVVGFTAPGGVTYKADNNLENINYTNGTVVNYSYDLNSRLSSLQVSQSGQNILNLGYTYDDNNNITVINDGGKSKTYEYDENNQLIKSVTPDKFVAPAKLSGASAQVVPDFKGASWMDYMQVLPGMMGLDYNAQSIGIDFGAVVPKLKQIKLVPGDGYQSHRITENTLDLYTSSNNSIYSLIPKNNWTFTKNDTTGVITISFNDTISTRYLKVHVKFDDRNSDGTCKDSAQFRNELAKMMEVYQEADSRTEEYQYDAAGNRRLLRVTLVRTDNYYSYYYSNSDRLKTDGKYAFDYDAAGNLIRKGNRFDISGDVVTFTTVGEGVEFWEYEYDLLNRLIRVQKNGTMVSEYDYDLEGLRVVKRAHGETRHYVFEGTEPILEKRIEQGTKKSYVFAFGKHLARVDGVIGDSNASKYFYHTDRVGSVKAVSNQSGQVVWKADYLVFGSRYGEDGEFEEGHGFTGKEYDSDTGLYYFNARWYDSELGRFISEDPVTDPNNPNIYSYCSNNPLRYNDPTGLDQGDVDDYSWLSDVFKGGGSSGGGSSDSSSTKKAIDDFWKNKDYFKGNWWQDSKKQLEALAMLYIEMRVEGPEAFLRSGAKANPDKIRAVQSALNVKVTGEWDLNTVAAVENVQTRCNVPNAIGTTIGKNTMEALISRATGRAEWYEKHPTYKSFINLMEQAEIGEGFYALCIGIAGCMHVKGPGTRVLGDDAIGKNNVPNQPKNTNQIKENTKVYRVWGGKARPDGRSWTTEDPSTVPNYRDAAGLPNGNTGQYVSEGQIIDTTGVKVKAADPLDGNSGGLNEIVIPDPGKQVRLNSVSGVNPEF